MDCPQVRKPLAGVISVSIFLFSSFKSSQGHVAQVSLEIIINSKEDLNLLIPLPPFPKILDVDHRPPYLVRYTS